MVDRINYVINVISFKALTINYLHQGQGIYFSQCLFNSITQKAMNRSGAGKRHMLCSDSQAEIWHAVLVWVLSRYSHSPNTWRFYICKTFLDPGKLNYFCDNVKSVGRVWARVWVSGGNITEHMQWVTQCVLKPGRQGFWGCAPREQLSVGRMGTILQSGIQVSLIHPWC